MIFEDRNLSKEEIIQKAAQSFNDFRSATLQAPSSDNLQLSSAQPQVQNRNNRWIKPGQGFMKAHCDANLQISEI